MANNDVIQEACKRLECTSENLEVSSWQESFSTTAGPNRGMIAGQAFTNFDVDGFRVQGEEKGIKHCAGKWKEWSGVSEELWDTPSQTKFKM